MNLGKNIKKYRTKIGLTQKELADKLHVTPQAVSRWELDTVEPSLDTIKDMAVLFNVDYNELMGEENKVVHEDKENLDEEINRKLDTLLEHMDNQPSDEENFDIGEFIRHGDTIYVSKKDKKHFNIFRFTIIALFFLIICNVIINYSLAFILKNGYELLGWTDIIASTIMCGFLFRIFWYHYHTSKNNLRYASRVKLIKSKQIDIFWTSISLTLGWKLGVIISFLLQALCIIACFEKPDIYLVNIVLLFLQVSMELVAFILFLNLVASYTVIFFEGLFKNKFVRIVSDLDSGDPMLFEEVYLARHSEKEYLFEE